MVRTESLLLRNAIFGVACAVFAALLAFRGEAARVSDDSTGQGPAFSPIAVEKVTALEVERTTKVDGKDVKESVRIVRAGVAAWKLANSFDYPADTGKVESYLKTLNGVKRHSEPTSNPAKFAEYAGTEGFLEVRVFENDGSPSVAFGIGKSSPESYTKKFVRVDGIAPGNSRVLVVSGLDAYGSPTSATHWVETRMLPALSSAEIAELLIDQGEAKRKVSFARGAKKGEKDSDGKNIDDPWNMTAPTSEPALAEPVMSLVRGFVGLTFASVEAGATTAADDAKFGFDKPDLILTGVGKPPVDPKHPTASWTVVIGKKVDGKSAWYARRSTGKTDDPFVFTVNDYDLSEFRKEPATWLEKKPEVPPTAPGGDAPAMGEAAPAMEGAAPGTTPPAMTDAPEAPPGMGVAPPTPAPETPKGPETPKDAPPPAPVPASETPAVPEAPKLPETPKDAPPPK